MEHPRSRLRIDVNFMYFWTRLLFPIVRPFRHKCSGQVVFSLVLFLPLPDY